MRSCPNNTCWAFLVVLHCGMLGCSSDAATQASSRRPVAVLVHGITWDLEQPTGIWGHVKNRTDSEHEWNGMIGHLEGEGYRFGGVIRCNGSNIALPSCLDTAGTTGNPRSANLFALEFSPSANADGLSYKTLELVRCLQELRKFTGCNKVCIVAHSAGGIVARAYLQNAVPGVEYKGDVDRLITIGTPHLGAAIASHFGDFLGIRATSLKPNADLIRRLNGPLDLPTDVRFASIVVRGIAADVRGTAHAYEHLVDRSLLVKMPVDYREGGDQVVHVCSQNLHLAECARRYETTTGRPVQYILVRVPDPTPEDLSPFEEKVHEAAPRNRTVQEWVGKLLADDGSLWAPVPPARFDERVQSQVELSAFGIIESEALRRHPLTQVNSVDVERCDLTESDGTLKTYRFSGTATWGKSKSKPHRTNIAGQMVLSFDRFGRIESCQSSITHAQDK